MSFFHFIQYVVVFLVVVHLFSKLINPALKLLLGIHNLKLTIGDSLCVVFLERCFFLFQLCLEVVEQLLAFSLLCCVLVLQLFQFILHIVLLFLFVQYFFLTVNNSVCVFKNCLDFSLVGTCQCRRVHVIFLVFGMEMEDNLGELGDLLGHLVVSFLRYLLLGHTFLI